MNVTTTMARHIRAMPPYVSPTYPLYCLVTRVTLNNVIFNVIPSVSRNGSPEYDDVHVSLAATDRLRLKGILSC